MRPYGTIRSNDFIPIAPDTVGQIVFAANTPQAFAWPSSEAEYIRLQGASTAGAGLGFAANLVTTGAHWPAASIAISTASSGLQTIVPPGGSLLMARPAGSTGFSLVMPTSGIMSAEFWHK